MFKVRLISAFILAIGLLFLTKTQAQTTTGTLKGKTLDAKTNETIPFLSVLVYTDADSVAAKSIQTDVNGNFSISNLAFGVYNIKFSFIGYQTKTISKVVLFDANPSIDLGNIPLSNDDKLLNEVVVEYKRPVVEMLDDKLVYNVDQTIFSEGSVATDILKNVPMVTVDLDGKATIAGKRNTRVFIDGKPSDYNAASIGDLLSVLPSDAIESIEVVTDPSSKFDADGDGIINIVLKKGRKVGLTGNLNSQVGTQGNHNTGAFISKKTTKYSFTSNIGYSHTNRLFDGGSVRSNVFTDTTTYNDQTNNNDRITDGFNGRYGGSWQIDTAKNLRFSARGGFNKAYNSTVNDNLFLNEQKIGQTLRLQNNNSSNRNFDYAVDAVYTINKKAKGNYDFGLNYSKNSSLNDREFARFLLNADGTPRTTNPTLQLNDNNDLGHNIDLNADYDRGFKFLNSRLEVGLKTTINVSDNSQAVQNFDYTINDYVFNPNLTNAFTFNQNIYAAYASYRFKIQKWSFRMGNRAEVTNVKFIQESNPNISIDPYINFFPSFGINRTFKSKYSIGLSYSKRVARPRAVSLNPLIDDSDPQNLRFGNPNLVPSFTDQVELNFSVFGKDWSVSPRFSYAKSNKIIERIRTVSSDGNTVTTYQNLANSTSLNFNVFGNYRIDKRKTFNAGFTLSQVDYNSTANASFNRKGINIRSNAGISYTFKNNAAFEANLNYFRNTAAQGVSSGSVETQFGLRKNFYKNKIGLRFTAIDPFTQRNLTTITQGQNFYQESFSVQRTRNFMLALSYRFTKIDTKPVATIPQKKKS